MIGPLSLPNTQLLFTPDPVKLRARPLTKKFSSQLFIIPAGFSPKINMKMYFKINVILLGIYL